MILHPARRRKLLPLLLLLIAVALATALVLYALRQNISLFYSPSQLLAGEAPVGRLIRVGGLVVRGSLQRGSDLSVRFQLTDQEKTVDLAYQGILPDLFREGQGIVAQGRWTMDHRFQAVTVLAKHDEKYMPPEVKSSLRPARVIP